MKQSTPIFLLPSRLILFLVFQLLIGIGIGSFGNSEKYWLFSATITNIVSILILIYVFKLEGRRFMELFRFERTSLKKDLLLFLGIALVCGPVVFMPNYWLSTWFWGSMETPNSLMFKPVSINLVYFLLLAFPVTIAFAELATYFGYIMPRLKEQFKQKWPAVALPVVFLAIQHCTLPFIPDIKFIAYRALVFLPFAALIGITLYYRPRLFPYFAILHGLLDLGTVMVLFKIAIR